MIYKILSLFILTSIVFQTTVSAGIFKCVKKNGDVYYNDKPCTAGLKEKKVTIDKVPSSKVVRNKKPKAFDANQGAEAVNLEGMKNPVHLTPALQAMYLKKQREAMLKHELAVDDGSYEMTEEEKKSLKVITDRQEKLKAESRRKEAIKVAKEKERNRLALIEQKRREKKVARSLANHAAKKRVSDYKNLMESKERSGAMMTDEEKNWRDMDKETIATQALHNENVNSPGTKAYKDNQQAIRASGFAEQRQRQFERDFNNTPPPAR